MEPFPANDPYFALAIEQQVITGAQLRQLIEAWRQYGDGSTLREHAVNHGLISARQHAWLINAIADVETSTAKRDGAPVERTMELTFTPGGALPTSAPPATAVPIATAKTRAPFSTDQPWIATVSGVDPAVDLAGRETGIETAGAKYKAVHVLGRGGMGEVVLAADRDLRREVAIKTLLAADTASHRIRFVEEAQVTGQLEHPNIVPVHELGLDEHGRPYIAMKRVRGRSLGDLLEAIKTGKPADLDLLTRSGDLRPRAGPTMRAAGHDRTPGGTRVSNRLTRRGTSRRHVSSIRGPATAGDACEAQSSADTSPPRLLAGLLNAFGKVCDAVAYAHSRGVLHRDLKPDNVMIGEFGEVLLMDWGLAKVIGREPLPQTMYDDVSAVVTARTDTGDAAVRTAAGTIAGTPMYMPPEQARGEIDQLDERSDIYSLGAILYEILTLTMPVEAANVYELLAKVERGVVTPPRARSAAPWSIPAELDAIVMKAMARNPAGRYQSATELRLDIEAYHANLPVTAMRPSPWQRIVKWTRRHPAATLTGAIGAAAASIVAVVVGIAITQAAESSAELARSDARTARAEQRAREAELLRLAQEGELEQVIETLGGQMRRQRDAAADEFIEAHATAMDERVSDDAFIARLGPAKVQGYLAAFDRLFAAHQAYPDRIEVTSGDHFARGMLLHLGFHELERALVDYSRSIDLEDNAVARNARGLVYVLLNRYADARADLVRAIELAPTLAIAHSNLGIAYRRQGQPQRALEYLEEAARLEPENPGFVVNIALAYWDLGRRDECELRFAHAIEIDPRLALTYYNRARLRDQAGDEQGALADYGAAIVRDANHGDAYVFRGTLRLNLGLYRGAIDDFVQAMRLKPDDAALHRLRGNAYVNLGDHVAALADLDRALELDPRERRANAEVYQLRGRAHLSLGDVPAALAEINHALRLDPDNALLYADRGDAYLSGRDFALAIEDYDRALARDERAEWYRNRGTAYALDGHYIQAEADFSSAIRVEPDHAPTYINRASARFGQGRLDDGIADLTESIRLEPSALAYQKRGRIWLFQKDGTRAQADIDRALELDPDMVEALFDRANLNAAWQRYENALTDYDEVIRRMPRYWRAYMNRGLALARLDRREAAMDSYDQALQLAPAEEHAAILQSRRIALGE